jgi:AcrR family transcriptional regulator
MIYREAVSPAKNTEPAARPARRRLPPDDRRQALINSALKLFNARPYDEVSVDDIAAEAGMSRPLVYHYYGGKAGVFISALRQTGDDVVEAVAKAGMDDPDNWLTAGLSAFFDHIQANPIGLTALYRHGSVTGLEDRRVLDEIGDRVLRLVMASLDPPGDSPVLQSVVRGWIAMVETMAGGWLRQGQPTREQLESLMPDVLRAVLGAAAWHDAATAAVLPRLPPRGRQLTGPMTTNGTTHVPSSEVSRLWHQATKADLSPGRLPWSPAARARSGWPAAGGWPRTAPW